MGRQASPVVKPGGEMDDMVAEYVKDLDGLGAENAWFSLVELGPSVLPQLRGAYYQARNAQVRSGLIRVIRELRDRGSFDLLESALSENEPIVWQAALDALVTLGGADAVAALHRASRNAVSDKMVWVREALAQVQSKQ